MGVYIKNMETPTTCRDCRLSTFTDFDSMPFCNVTMDDICFNDWETKRCDNCPLIPVPKHGRLIDADALDADLEWQDMHTGEWDAVGFSIEEIENAPTIIPAEEGET